MTVTLQLTPEQVEIAQKIAKERNTDIETLLSQIITDFLQGKAEDPTARVMGLQYPDMPIGGS